MVNWLLFDLDGTLYPETSGLFEVVRERIVAWTMHALQLSLADAQELRRQYFQKYGTTMGGLIREHPELDIDAYLEYVHEIDVTRYLTPDPALAALLARLPAPKAIFTNSITGWAERITAWLGIRDAFDRIIDVRAVGYCGKPHPQAYARALALLGQPPDACLMLDDQVSYLRGAAEAGLHTFLVRPDAISTDGIEFAAPSLYAAEPQVRLMIGNAQNEMGIAIN